MGSSPSWRTGELSTPPRRRYACLPVTNAAASPARRLLFDHRRDLRIVDPLSNHSNRRRPAVRLIDGVYARRRCHIASGITLRPGCRSGLSRPNERGRARERERFENPAILPRLPSPIMPASNGRPRGPDYLRAGRRHADVA